MQEASPLSPPPLPSSLRNAVRGPKTKTMPVLSSSSLTRCSQKARKQKKEGGRGLRLVYVSIHMCVYNICARDALRHEETSPSVGGPGERDVSLFLLVVLCIFSIQDAPWKKKKKMSGVAVGRRLSRCYVIISKWRGQFLMRG